MPDLTIPLIAATVFTVVGYGILRAERNAESIGDVLSAAFVLCVSMTAIGMTGFFASRQRPMPDVTAAVTVQQLQPSAASTSSSAYWTGD